MGLIFGLARGVPVWTWALAAALAYGGWQHHRATAAGHAILKAQQELAAVRADAAQTTVTALTRAIAGQQEAIHEAQAQTVAAETGRAAATAGLARLLDRYRAAERVRSPAAAASGSAPAAGLDLYTQLLGSVGEAAGRFAAAADRARIAGQACERAYEAAGPVKP